MNKKQLKTQCDKLNGIIASQNLYSNGRRYIHAEVINGVVTVLDLYTEQRIPYTDNQFTNGNGTIVAL